MAVEDGLHREFAGLDLGLDAGTEHPEGVEALRAGPLGEDRILRDDLDRGDVVDTGVAENVPCRVALGHTARALADDDAELALVHHLPAVGFRPADRLAVREERVVALEKIQWLGRGPLIEVRKELVIVVDQRDDLAPHAPPGPPRRAERDRPGGRLRAPEHAAPLT